MIANSVFQDSNGNYILEMTNKDLHGIYDGGHTYQMILDHRNIDGNPDKTTMGTSIIFLLLKIIKMRQICPTSKANNISKYRYTEYVLYNVY